MRFIRAIIVAVCLFIGGGSVFAQQSRFIFEVTAKNNASHVSTVMRVFAENADEARQQVELNGWQVGLVRQISFRRGDAYVVKIGDEPVRYVPAEEVRERDNISDEDLILSILGPPPSDDPLPLPEPETVADEGDKLQYVMTVYFPFGDIDPVVGDAEKAKFAELDNSSYYFLFGHTDSVRTSPLNKTYVDNFELSFKRAEAVKAILEGYGKDSGKMSTVGFGAMQPAVAERASQSGTLENRRVEIFLKKRL